MVNRTQPTIALTGATGFLGSHLMAALLEKEYQVIIFGRSVNGKSLRDRIIKLLTWFGIENRIRQVEMVKIDFLKPHLDIPESTYTQLCARTEQIIHCASDTSFSERKRAQVLNSNVYSLPGILEFAANARVNFFHYISTAYVAGINGAICKERLSTTTSFVNVYEESKAQAERTIAAFCEKNSIPLTIIRPAIVYGDSQTGRSLKFKALYYPIRSLQNIRDIYLNDIRNHGGEKSLKNGISLDHEGFLFLPLRIYLPIEGTINLIPIDYFVNATIKIIENALPGGIYHLTNNSSTKLDTIAAYNEQFMQLKGVEIIYGKSGNNRTRNPAEELFDRFIEPYRPYMADTRIFDRTNTDMIIGDLHPPEFTYEIFKRCMEYAIQVGWGETLF